MAEFSSQGFADDGRIKPDVVAPGFFVWSAASADSSSRTCDLVHMAGLCAGFLLVILGHSMSGCLQFGYPLGTSMATPVVAGNSAQVRQYYREGHYNKYFTGTQTPMSPLPSGGEMVNT